MFYLILAVVAVLIFLLLSKKYGSEQTGQWLRRGGMLGIAIFIAKFVRLPLVTILSVFPFLLPQLRRAEQEQKQNNISITRDEAALILGISVGAPHEEIKEAHRRLIAKNHPDTGGSDYLAAKINQARDILLGG